MRILLIGGGGREHAIARAIARSKGPVELYVYSNNRNPGIVSLAQEIQIGRLNETQQIAQYAADRRIELAIPGPEEPLMHGLADELEKCRIPCAGPRSSLARLEGNKAFLRQLAAYSVSRANPGFFLCTQPDEISQALMQLGQAVIKPLGLTSGKGVRVMGKQLASPAEAAEYAQEILTREGRVLIEELLDGEEFSLMAFSDGNRLVPMPLVQDAKYAYEGDTGPMTGGMGAYTEADGGLPFITAKMQSDAVAILTEIIRAAQDEMQQEYKGAVYGQFMATASGPKIIEINVRFGDPEAINLTSLLKTDPVEVFAGTVHGLPETIEFEKWASVCKYLVPAGYPEAVGDLAPVVLDEDALSKQGVQLIYAGAEQTGKEVRPTGSRFAALLAMRESLEEAEASVETSLEDLDLLGLRWRHDVASPALLGQRMDHARKLGIMG